MIKDVFDVLILLRFFEKISERGTRYQNFIENKG